MKIRTGFVSNSSSSSFLIYAAKVTDLTKFLKYLEDNNIPISKESHYNIPQLTTTSKILANDVYGISHEFGTLVLESFTGAEVYLDINPEIEENFLILNFTGNEGDGDYPFNFQDGDVDYDCCVDEDYFSDLRYLFKLNEEQGISEKQYSIGAGRDG